MNRSRTLLALVFVCVLMLVSLPATALDMRGRLGVGTSREFIHNLPALSVKIQRNDHLALGALMALSSSETDGGYGIGAKVYRIIYDEPYLNFYTSFLLGLLNSKTENESGNGFQLDATFGSEFHFYGMQSLGFSFEAGLSANKLYDEFTIQTVGLDLIRAGVHFYF